MKDHYKVLTTIFATLLCVVGLLFFVPGFNYKLVYIPTKSYCRDTLICNIDSTTTLNVSLDSIIDQKCNRLSELEMIKRLENRGLIISPDEYTSRISSYYSVLVAFLVGLFVIFTILSFFSIKNSFSEEFEKEKRSISGKFEQEKQKLEEGEQKINEEVKNKVRNLLVDSVEIRDKMSEYISGDIEDKISESIKGDIVEEVIKKLREDANNTECIEDKKLELEKIKNDIDTLFNTMIELENDVAAKNNIS